MEYLKSLLKEDVWNIIEKEKRKEINFESAVLHSLTNSDSFMVGDAIMMANKIRKAYNEVLDEVEKYINEGVEILSILRSINKKYEDNIRPLLNKLVDMNSKKLMKSLVNI